MCNPHGRHEDMEDEKTQIHLHEKAEERRIQCLYKGKVMESSGSHMH